jgi:hypothetical protein
MPTVATRAEQALKASGIAVRCEVVAGDFFEQVPPGADGYLLANVLHDWRDDQVVAILTNCRRAMTKEGKVLIVERLIADDPAEAVPTLLSNINMLVLTGGQERTNAEYGALLEAAGLRLGDNSPSLQGRGFYGLAPMLCCPTAVMVVSFNTGEVECAAPASRTSTRSNVR